MNGKEPQNRGRHAINVVPSLRNRPWDMPSFSAGFHKTSRQASCDGPDQQSSRRNSGRMSPVIITLLVLLGVGLLLALWLMSIYNGLFVTRSRPQRATLFPYAPPGHLS